MIIYDIIQKQKTFYNTGKTKSITFRLNALNKLKKAIIANESKILEALKKDLNKSRFESYMTEIGIVLDEIRYFIKHTPEWVKPQYVKTPIPQFPAKSFVISEPYGVALVISPWNYPFGLSISPMIGAIAAGNCVVLKPSEYSVHTSKILADLIRETFSPDYITVVEGGVDTSNELLEQNLDYIFFTGSVQVGKIVMEKAAKNLIPVSLELGGKSPCIVDKEADIKLAAKRIVFGKYLNAGQTCVAPDYIYVHEDVKDSLVKYLKKYIIKFYGSNPLQNPHYPKIINEKHQKRILDLLKGEEILYGGESNLRTQIAPTLVDGITATSPIMQEEIFGPVLPIITYKHLHEVKDYIVKNEKPLALYLFTTNKKVEGYILKHIAFGGGCINDTIIHLATPYMGFGGVGHSGIGSYHGKFSFDTFSHKKSVVKKGNWFDLPLRYHPYTERKERLLRKFLK